MPLEAHEAVAQDYMRDKGLDEARPVEVRSVGRYAWRFRYALPDGDFTLHVQWSQSAGWSAVSRGFTLRDDPTTSR